MEKNFEKEFAEILSKAIEHFDPSAKNDVSILTIIANVDKNNAR